MVRDTLDAVSPANLVAQSFSLLLPILVSGLFFIVTIHRGWLGRLNNPIDGGSTFRRKPFLGSSKTWRGVIIYVLGAILVATILHQVSSIIPDWVAPEYRTNPLVFGALIGTSYVAGELLNSFVKRRIGIEPSSQASSTIARRIQGVFDNVDGMLANGLVLIVFYQTSIDLLVTSGVLAIVVHASTDVLMRRLRLKGQVQ